MYLGPLEKLENCPYCKKDLEQGEYDCQVCRSCKTGVDFKKEGAKNG